MSRRLIQFSIPTALLLMTASAAMAACPAGGTIYAGGQGIGTLNSNYNPVTFNFITAAASPYPSTLTIPATVTGTVTSVCVTITGLNANYTQGTNSAGTVGLAIALQAPSGQLLGIMGSTSTGTQSLTNVTLDITDSATGYMPSAPLGQSWPATTGTITDKPSSYGNSFNDTVFPTEGAVAGFTLDTAQLPVETVDPGDNQGSSTLNSAFTGATAAGIWKLYVVDSSGGTDDNISFSSWSLTITVSQTAVSTATTLSSSLNPSFTSGTNSGVALTSVVSSSDGTPTGTVNFQDGGNSIAGCGAEVLAGGRATCSTVFTAEGVHTLTASYTPAGGSFTSSSTNSPLYQYVKHHSTLSGGLYCNPGTISITPGGNGDVTNVYPSVVNVGTDTAGLAASVSNVSVRFNTLSSTNGAALLHALLESPDGNHALEFMSGAGDGSSQPTIDNLTWSDSGVVAPNFTSFGGNTPAPLANDATYQAISEDTANLFPTTVGGAVPSFPSTFSFATPGGGANSKNFEEAFNGATSDGDWKLFVFDNGGAGTQTISGWCIDITPASGSPTATAITSSANPAISVPVTITATVRNPNTQVAATSGAVTFTENGNPVAGGPSGAVAVSANGTASFATNSLSQGDHTILATFTDSSGTYNESLATLVQRVDNATPAPSVSGSVYTYCNTGSIAIPGPENPTDQGPGYPNPSNIFVTGLPGATQDVQVTLNSFSSLDPGLVQSLLVGPGAQAANTLDFFSDSGGENNQAIPVTLSFDDHNAQPAPGQDTPFAGPGTYNYLPTDNLTTDSFTSSASGLYIVPGSFQLASPAGAHSLDGTFAAAGANNNGTWSLYFNQSAGSLGGAVSGGWCVAFNQSLPKLTITKTPQIAGNMVQGETGFAYDITVGNAGPGSLAGQVSVTDTPSTGLSITGMSGMGWTCSGATCTRSDALAEGNSYPAIAVTVTVAANAVSPQTNYATVSGGGSGNSPLKSNTVSTTVLQSTTTVVGNFPATYSESSQNVVLSASVSSGGAPVNGGTVTFTIGGIAGSATSGTVTNGNASATFVVPAGTAASTYQISATYNPGAAFSSSTGSGALTINQAGTTTTAANASVPFSAASQNVTLTASLSSSAGPVNSGTVTFTINGIPGSVTSRAVTNGSAGVTFPVPAGATAAVYTLTAAYNPGSNFLGSSDSSHTLTVMAPAATAVENVSSSDANGTYGLGTAIPIQITFSNVVNVTGTPMLALNDGATASYASGSGTATLTFLYTVAAGQNTPLLNEASTAALSLNGGTIFDINAQPAMLTLPAPGAAGSLGANKQIAIDTTSPQVVSYSVDFGSTSYDLVGASRTGHLPWTITGITVVFSKPIEVATTGSLGGITATGLSGVGTTTLTWSFGPISNAALSTTLAGSGVNAIQDGEGNALAGGSGFVQNFSVLYADFNGDGAVTASDMTGVNAARNHVYSMLADLNGDGVVNIADVTIARQQQGATQH